MALHRRRFLALAAVLPALARAHDDHKQHAAQKPQPPKSVKVSLADTPLLDQEGRSVRLKTDVMAGRVVVVDFIYTTCTTICPIFTATMSGLQEKLADLPARDVKLISMTVDPLRDTPPRLKDYAGKHNARFDNWSFLTGTKGDVDSVNRAFGSYTPSIDDHPPMVMVGDTASGQWTRFFGFPSVGDLEARVRQLLAARKASS